MNTNDIIAKLAEVEAIVADLKAELSRELHPVRLAFVNFFPGGKSYAYNANNDIAEGDVVMVPTASRGNIPGVVTLVKDYAENEVPFRDTKTVIGKLEELDIAPADLIRMTTELAPAIADKEASKARLIAFLDRQTQRSAVANGISSNDEPVVAESSHNTFGDDWDDGNGEIEGDTTTPELGGAEPETTVQGA